jgi:membrane protease YdiL (CAAX protease family)
VKWEELFVINGRLRPAWRFIIAAALVALAQLGVGIILGVVFGIAGREFTHVIFWASCLTLPALLAVFKILTSLFEGKPLGSMGLAFCGRWKTELGMGMALGTAMVLTVAGLEWGWGVAHFAWNSISVQGALAGGAYYLVLFALAATNEELMFRGYPFQRLVDAIGPSGAVVLSSVMFGLVHLGNPSRTWLSTLNTVLVGVPLAVAYLRTRALWLPIGIHFSWNFLQSYALGFQVSGIQFLRTLLKVQVHGLEWLSGGDYGPEGSGLATIVIAAATAYLMLSRSIYISEEMRELAFGTASPAQASPAQGLAIDSTCPAENERPA